MALQSGSGVQDEGDDVVKAEVMYPPSVEALARPPVHTDAKLAWMSSVRECPVFYPSCEEFTNPIAYTESIREAIGPYGMAKIVPPVLASTGCVDALRSHKVPVQQQLVRSEPWDDLGKVRGCTYQLRTMSAFSKIADLVLNKVFRTTLAMPASAVEVCCLFTDTNAVWHFH
jgi:hypothetical protein